MKKEENLWRFTRNGKKKTYVRPINLPNECYGSAPMGRIAFMKFIHRLLYSNDSNIKHDDVTREAKS